MKPIYWIILIAAALAAVYYIFMAPAAEEPATGTGYTTPTGDVTLQPQDEFTADLPPVDAGLPITDAGTAPIKEPAVNTGILVLPQALA